MATQVYGVRETLKELKAIEPKLRSSVTRAAKKAADPLRADAQSRVPTSPPLSGWREWSPSETRVAIRFGGRARGDKEVWPLLRMVHAKKSGAMFDMVGRANKPNSASGVAFIAGLNRIGSASRSLWPAAEAGLPTVNRAVTKAISDEITRVNRTLAYREV
jgi:hypothetical protein